MTTPDTTADGLIGKFPTAPSPDAAPLSPDLGDTPTPPDLGETPTAPEPAPRRRRKMFLLFLLAALTALFLMFAVWYLLFRKPISEFVIPPVDANAPPTFFAAYYDMVKPLSVAVTPDGSRIYVTQADGSQETLLFDNRGTKLGVLAPPTTITEHATQVHLAIDPQSGDVYATDRAGGQIYIYGSDGTFKRRFDPGLAYAGWQPFGITFDKAGNLYVSDVGGAYQTIHEFGRDAKLVRDFGSPGLFAFPNGIAVADDGTLYVSDSNNGRVLIFSADGQQQGLIQRGTAPGSLGLPRGIVIDDRGRLTVVDSVAQAVQVYRLLQPGEQAPELLTKFGTEGTVDGAFEFPNGIAVDARGHVYVADWNNDRVQVWSY